jgi:hypothetical protein
MNEDGSLSHHVQRLEEKIDRLDEKVDRELKALHEKVDALPLALCTMLSGMTAAGQKYLQELARTFKARDTE